MEYMQTLSLLTQFHLLKFGLQWNFNMILRESGLYEHVIQNWNHLMKLNQRMLPNKSNTLRKNCNDLRSQIKQSWKVIHSSDIFNLF